MASTLPPLSAHRGGLPRLHDSGSIVAADPQPDVAAGDLDEARPPRKLRNIKSAAPRVPTTRQLSELGHTFHSVKVRRDRDAERRSRVSSSLGQGRSSTTDLRRRSQTSMDALNTSRPQSSQARPSSSLSSGSMNKRCSISSPAALDDSRSASPCELPRIRRDRVSSAMPRLSTGGTSSFRPNSLALTRPTSATGRSRPSPTSPQQQFQTLLEEDHDEMSEEAFLADMTEDEFEEWIAAQERGDRAKIATLRRLLIIKKLGIDTRDKMADFKSGRVAIPDFHCEHCKNHWLRHNRLPDECPEERRKRLQQEAEEARRRRSSARRRRRSKNGKTFNGDDGYAYEEYIAEDGTVKQRRRKRKGGGNGGDDNDSDGDADGSGRRSRCGNGGTHSIAEDEEDDDIAGGQHRRAGGGRSGGRGNDGNADGGVHGDGQFVGADGKLYTGGKVSGDFGVDDIPGYGKDERGRNGGAGGSDGGHNDSQGLSELMRKGRGGADGDISGYLAGRDGLGRGQGGGDGKGGLGKGNGSAMTDINNILHNGRLASDGSSSNDLHDSFGKGRGFGSSSGLVGGGNGYDSDGDGSLTAADRRAGRRYGRNGDQTDGSLPGDGGGGDHGKHGRRSRRGSVTGGGLEDENKTGGYLRSGNVSDEDADGRYGGKGGHFGRRFHRRTSKDDGGAGPAELEEDFARGLQLENIRHFFTRPFSFSYFPSKAEMEDSSDET